MKRTYRNDMSNQQKQAISQANTGKKHSEEHKRRIARALEKYWASLPVKPEEENNNLTTSEKIYGENK